ncbi:hypothetical protein [Marinobacter sp.]|uniref:hypothetical protein n=1 Tax=Marinobacter sp. TaxID=50741 RepID=UPI00198C6DC6|nr:hypothetical protein [Marinobacter sp.]MBC7192802.1 protein-export chaperone SecB [Marinobacter sp.]
MKLASMQLKHYHYTRLLLEANDSADISDSDMRNSPYREPEAGKLKTSIVLGEPDALEEGAERFFLLTLGLEYSEPDFPYHFAVELDGIFVPDEQEVESEDAKNRLVVNAASILYSSVRDQLLTLSARHKYGPMMLPSVDFHTIAPQS